MGKDCMQGLLEVLNSLNAVKVGWLGNDEAKKRIASNRLLDISRGVDGLIENCGFPEIVEVGYDKRKIHLRNYALELADKEYIHQGEIEALQEAIDLSVSGVTCNCRPKE